MAESEEELKSLLRKVKEESEKVGLKPNIQKPKIMASSPITSWQIDGETKKQRQTIFLGSKVTVDGDCSHEIKRCLLLRRKAMTNLDSVLKSRDITLPTKVHLVKALIIPVIMYGCESWTIKKAESWRIGTFELWCWRSLLRVPWTAMRSNQSILKEISPKHSLEGMMMKLKLKLQYFGHLMPRANSLEKTLMLGKIEGRRRRGQQRTRRLDGITGSMDMSLSKLWEPVKTRLTALRGATESRMRLSNWATIKPPGYVKAVLLKALGLCNLTFIVDQCNREDVWTDLDLVSCYYFGPQEFSGLWVLTLYREGLENAEATPCSCPISPFPWAHSPHPRLKTSVVGNVRRRRADRPSRSKQCPENNNPPWKHCTIHYNSWSSAMKIKTPSCRSANYTCKQLQTLSEV